jgi:hypothetical protein
MSLPAIGWPQVQLHVAAECAGGRVPQVRSAQVGQAQVRGGGGRALEAGRAGGLHGVDKLALAL